MVVAVIDNGCMKKFEDRDFVRDGQSWGTFVVFGNECFEMWMWGSFGEGNRQDWCVGSSVWNLIVSFDENFHMIVLCVSFVNRCNQFVMND